MSSVYGQCAKCGGSLTSGHVCPDQPLTAIGRLAGDRPELPKALTKDPQPTTKERLFNLFIQEHGVTLLESELEEIIALIRRDERQRCVGYLKRIDEMERVRMYEGCPDCYSDTLGCSREAGCQQFKGRTPIQKVIDEVIKELEHE